MSFVNKTSILSLRVCLCVGDSWYRKHSTTLHRFERIGFVAMAPQSQHYLYHSRRLIRRKVPINYDNSVWLLNFWILFLISFSFLLFFSLLVCGNCTYIIHGHLVGILRWRRIVDSIRPDFAFKNTLCALHALISFHNRIHIFVNGIFLLSRPILLRQLLFSAHMLHFSYFSFEEIFRMENTTSILYFENRIDFAYVSIMNDVENLFKSNILA